MAFDIWTLALQAVNLAILVWLLSRFFYRPVAAMVAERQSKANKILADAESARAEAEEAKAGLAAARNAIAAEREQTLSAAKRDAELARATLLHDAEQQTQAERAKNETALQRERSAAEAAAMRHAAVLAADIARRLLDRLPKEASTALFVAAVENDIAKLNDEHRRLLAAGVAHGDEFEITSAAPLDESLRQRCVSKLEAAAGGKVIVAFHTDPDLVGGLEIRSPVFVLDDSWRADLDRIIMDLNRDAAVP